MRIRGPVGPVRSDYYATYLALHARKAIGNKDGSLDSVHFRHLWETFDQPQLAAIDDPYDTYDPVRDGEVFL